MKNKLNRLLRPNMSVYFAAMGVFSGIALLLQQYWLGTIMGIAALLLFTLYNMDRGYRQKELQKYLRGITAGIPGTAYPDQRTGILSGKCLRDVNGDISIGIGSAGFAPADSGVRGNFINCAAHGSTEIDQ